MQHEGTLERDHAARGARGRLGPGPAAPVRHWPRGPAAAAAGAGPGAQSRATVSLLESESLDRTRTRALTRTRSHGGTARQRFRVRAAAVGRLGSFGAPGQETWPLARPILATSGLRSR
jgi:hypothetical protein